MQINKEDTFKFMVNKKQKKITIIIPAKNNGKFRFKTRKSKIEFGSSFSPRKNNFDNQVYLEWQIGYDAVISDIKKGTKLTSLKEYYFVGANKKKKYLFELSEYLQNAITLRLITINKINNLLKEIENYTIFLDNEKISTSIAKTKNINGIKFNETCVKLPTFFMINTPDNTQIEISIQKQQYATAVQPMLYFCIPIKSFNNYGDLINKQSIKGDFFEYNFNKSNASVLIDMIKIFAMLSKSHNHDVKEIIKILKKLNDNTANSFKR